MCFILFNVRKSLEQIGLKIVKYFDSKQQPDQVSTTFKEETFILASNQKINSNRKKLNKTQTGKSEIKK